ncbi:hypothetical protein F0344_23030 [Streptomyces finlayi]|uniref:Transcriptional regulator, AbiEi antitoxin, Type IV TA system n=1 Tax=Streptomyces finlayi TaxID=67296 RepID=A0A7G7BP39_9ACTN|nr:hypothetical protein [Streptomyces finlayi]QNE77104.1 hypothetical protein F0344_23030 [Streptomyces finlayi]
MAAATKADVRTLDRLAGRQRGLATSCQLQAAGLARSTIRRRCEPGGPWQWVLPRVTLMQTGAPDPYQRVLAAVLYAAEPASDPLSGTTAVVTGEAALSLYRVRGTGSGTVDVLLDEARRMRDVAYVRIRRTRRHPPSLLLEGVPCVRRPRAAADFVARETCQDRVRAILANTVQAGRCDPRDLLTELRAGHALRGAPLRAVADELLVGVRSIEEGRTRDVLRAGGVPEALWNPTLLTPDGTFLAVPDAYWPDEGVALEVDSEEFHLGATEYRATLRRRLKLEAQGVEVVSVAPALVRDHPDEVVAAVLAKLRLGAGRRAPIAVVVRA